MYIYSVYGLLKIIVVQKRFKKIFPDYWGAGGGYDRAFDKSFFLGTSRGEDRICGLSVDLTTTESQKGESRDATDGRPQKLLKLLAVEVLR